MSDQDFSRAISAFLAAVESPIETEESISEMMLDLQSYAPHAELSDLIFYSERSRTADEIVQEALFREQLWLEGGRDAVTAHVEKLMRAAIADPQTEISHRYSAMNLLAGIERD